MNSFSTTFILFLTIVWPIHAVAQSGLKGMVFLDENRNGIFDPGEQGLPGICVSNGKEVVQTNQSGEWKLPSGNVNSVFVIKPSGYSVPVDSDNIPRHFVAAGNSHDSTYIRFGLYPGNENRTFSALFFGDPQARGVKEVNYIMHDVVAECMDTDAAFGVTLGDIVADDPALFSEISQGIGQIGIPWYNIFGNHDHDREETDNSNKDKTFRKFFGPSTYAFEYADVAFIGINNIFFDTNGKYKAHITDDQLEFIQNYLAFVPPGKLVVFMMHAPLIRAENREKLYHVLRDREHTFSISGHVHEQMHVFIDESMGWQGKEPHHHLINAVVCGSWWCGLHDELGIPHATMNDGAPNGYSVITFSGNRYSIRFKAARRPASYQMNVYLPDEITPAALDTVDALVNVFAGSSRSVVEMRVGSNGQWIPMEQVDATDPQCMRMHRLSPLLNTGINGQPLENILGYKMDYPSITSHMWKGKIPNHLPAGTHTLTVRTTDMFNQTWTGHRIFRIRADSE